MKLWRSAARPSGKRKNRRPPRWLTLAAAEDWIRMTFLVPLAAVKEGSHISYHSPQPLIDRLLDTAPGWADVLKLLNGRFLFHSRNEQLKLPIRRFLLAQRCYYAQAVPSSPSASNPH